MFIDFFLELRKGKVPVSLKEYLTLLEAMKRGVADYNVELALRFAVVVVFVLGESDFCCDETFSSD